LVQVFPLTPEDYSIEVKIAGTSFAGMTGGGCIPHLQGNSPSETGNLFFSISS